MKAKINQHGHEIEKEEEDEKKGDEKMDTSNNETRWFVISANVGALESLIGWAVNMVKTVNDSKAARRQLEELQHHNRAMEQGRGLYLTQYKYGRGLYLDPYMNRV